MILESSNRQAPRGVLGFAGALALSAALVGPNFAPAQQVQAPAPAVASAPEPVLEPYGMLRGVQVIATIQVPPGFAVETDNGQEHTIRRLRYPDGSSIVLVHDAPANRVLIDQPYSVGVPLPTPALDEYTATAEQDRADRVSRYGVVNGSEKGWRQDTYKVARGSGRSNGFAAGYVGAPASKIALFNRALDSIVLAQVQLPAAPPVVAQQVQVTTAPPVVAQQVQVPAAPPVTAQQAQPVTPRTGVSNGTIDGSVGGVISQAYELYDKRDAAGAIAKLETLRLDRLSPHERARVEGIYFVIAVVLQRDRVKARTHLENMIASEGLNEQEVAAAREQLTRIDQGLPIMVARGVNSDQPVVRIQPEYPPRAQQNGLEGMVRLQFTVTERGTVKNATVVEAEPQRQEFEDAALRAVLRWRYMPRFVGDQAVERVGVQEIITFQLSDP